MEFEFVATDLLCICAYVRYVRLAPSMRIHCYDSVANVDNSDIFNHKRLFSSVCVYLSDFRRQSESTGLIRIGYSIKQYALLHTIKSAFRKLYTSHVCVWVQTKSTSFMASLTTVSKNSFNLK